MHTTTVRFPDEVWHDLKAVCERERIATAQYIREATIARLASSTTSPHIERQDRELAELRRRMERLERKWRITRRSSGSIAVFADERHARSHKYVAVAAPLPHEDREET